MEKYKRVLQYFIVLFVYSAIQFSAISAFAVDLNQDPRGGMVSGGREFVPNPKRPTVAHSSGGMLSGGVLNGLGNTNNETNALELLEEICSANAQASVDSTDLVELFQISQKQVLLECENHDGSARSISNCNTKTQRMNRIFGCL